MTKKDLEKWARENDLDERMVVRFVEQAIREQGTGWSALEVSTHLGNCTSTAYTPYGYRKNTTGEYVSHAYRSNFGWKNTYYQRAILAVSFGETDPEFVH